MLLVLEEGCQDGNAVLYDLGLVDRPEVGHDGLDQGQLDRRNCLLVAVLAGLLDVLEEHVPGLLLAEPGCYFWQFDDRYGPHLRLDVLQQLLKGLHHILLDDLLLEVGGNSNQRLYQGVPDPPALLAGVDQLDLLEHLLSDLLLLEGPGYNRGRLQGLDLDDVEGVLDEGVPDLEEVPPDGLLLHHCGQLLQILPHRPSQQRTGLIQRKALEDLPELTLLVVGQVGVGRGDQEAGCYFGGVGHILFAEGGDEGVVVLFVEGLVLPLGQLLEAADGLVPDRRLVQGGQHPQGVDEGGHLLGCTAVALEFEDALGHLIEEVVVVVHLLDDLDEVGDQLVLDPRVTWLLQDVPRTAPISDIFPAAASLSEGLSLLSSSMQTVQSSSPLSSMLIRPNSNLYQSGTHPSLSIAARSEVEGPPPGLGRLGEDPYIKQMNRISELSRASSSFVRQSGNARIAGKVLLGASVLSAVLGVSSYFESFSAEKEIEFRKSQLKLPVYKLTEEQMVNPPWNHENLDSWLYRRVQVVGRPIIRLAMQIPHYEFNAGGAEQVVPLVTREDEKHQNRQGLLFSRGWVPDSHKHVTCRTRIERVDRQKFVGFVSKMSELSNSQFFNGNAYQKGRLLYNNADLEDMAKSSELQNREQVAVAMIEQLHETGVYDERSSNRRANDCHFTDPFPWAKTEAGALQLGRMPWECRNDATHYFAASVFSFLVGASIF